MELAQESDGALADDRPETWSGSSEALEGHIALDEQVITSVGALARISSAFFDRCEIVLTDRQVIILKPSWPWGLRFDRGFARSDASVKRYKSRVDGSQLLVIAVGDEDLCFYISRKARDGGFEIVDALQ